MAEDSATESPGKRFRDNREAPSGASPYVALAETDQMQTRNTREGRAASIYFAVTFAVCWQHSVSPFGGLFTEVDCPALQAS
jgi:hypothetical protein